MHIILNGKPIEFDGATIADLIAHAAPQKPFAVALNTVFVPKPDYASTPLGERDSIEIVRPVVGG